MKIFVNQGVRRLFTAAGLLLLAALLTGQGLVWLAVNDYKNALIAHDSALVGALVQQGLDPASVVAAVTAPKTDDQRAAGRLALERAGVSAGLDYRFVPEAELFLRRYGIAALIASLTFSAAALAALVLFFVRQDRQLEAARQAVERFVQSGERAGAQGAVFALAEGSLDEGSLAQLFGAVNGMAASLTAHVQKEQHDREFLKETISDISHQLKTPLTALQMYIEILRDETSSNPMSAEFIDKSERELQRMEYLIQNLLKLARLDAGAIVLKNRPLALPAFLEAALGCFATRAAVEGKQVEITYPPGLMLVGDEQWLGEAVSNLVKNAFDHTTSGGLVQVICDETPLMVTITVQDNGSGIHPEDLPYIFKRFYRSRFSQDHQGIGIGLTLAQRIVERHGGSIVVESELGHGALFRMIFPKLTNL